MPVSFWGSARVQRKYPHVHPAAQMMLLVWHRIVSCACNILRRFFFFFSNSAMSCILSHIWLFYYCCPLVGEGGQFLIAGKLLLKGRSGDEEKARKRKKRYIYIKKPNFGQRLSLARLHSLFVSRRAHRGEMRHTYMKSAQEGRAALLCRCKAVQAGCAVSRWEGAFTIPTARPSAPSSPLFFFILEPPIACPCPAFFF